jgi:hypothetical protein
MTEDEQRRALHAIERNLTHADPAFAARMRAANPGGSGFPVMPALCALTYILVPIQALLFGWLSAVVTLDVIAAAVAIVLIRRRLREKKPHAH